MLRTRSWLLATTMVFAAMFMLALTAPAWAHHRSGHSGGGPQKAGSGIITEDTDDDGVPNAPDPYGDSDNKHPSGKDKHVEHGKSGNQGKAKSDPDNNGKGPDRTNGGVDQPGGSGGHDTLDQDGNNGCGNDDDFEDDNEGWCGGKGKPGGTPPGPPPCDLDPDMPGVQPCGNGGGGNGGGNGGGGSGDEQVLGDVVEPGPEDEVMGAVVRRAPHAVAGSRDGDLAFTGGEVGRLLLFTLGLAIIGAIMVIAGQGREELA